MAACKTMRAKFCKIKCLHFKWNANIAVTPKRYVTKMTDINDNNLRSDKLEDGSGDKTVDVFKETLDMKAIWKGTLFVNWFLKLFHGMYDESLSNCFNASS